MANSEKFCLRWNDFETNISTAFRELREEKDFFDVTLACDDSQIQAHKVILSACSPFFRNVLRRNPHQHPLLYLKGVKYKELLSVLNFMYQGEVNVAQEELNTFLAVAEDLRVKGLTQNNAGGSSAAEKPKPEPPKISRPPPREPPEREPIPAPKRPRPPVSQSYQQDDDDIQEVVPVVKSEPRDNTVATVSAPDNSFVSAPPPQPQPTHSANQQLQQQQAAQHQAQDTGALALGDSYADESYDYGQYDDGSYDDGSGMIDPNTGMPFQGGAGADGNKGDDVDLVQMLSMVSRDLDGSFQCPQCPLTTRSRTNLREHIESKHMESMYAIFCPVCEKQCKSSAALRVHTIRYHKQ